MKKNILFISFFFIQVSFLFSQNWPKVYFPNRGTDPFSVISCYDKGYLRCETDQRWWISSEKTHLFRLDQNGDLIWQQLYCQNDSLMIGADGSNMIVTPDYSYLINGCCYYPDSGTTGPRYLRPLIVKVDSTGNMEWELPWRYVNGASFHGMSNRSILDNQNIIYSCGRHIEGRNVQSVFHSDHCLPSMEISNNRNI